jgi:deazaflavin-dependent oxidoreductase (nitroreductase family)
MWAWVGLGAAGVAVLALLLWIAMFVVLRTQFQPGLDVIRRMNRRFTNPRVLRTAGAEGSSAAVINHVGRVTGASYRTPVDAVEAGVGFIIALPYGPDADWVQNVRAAGRATVEVDGQTYELTHPRLVSGDEGNRHFPAKAQRQHRMYGLDQFLALTDVSVPVSGEGNR